MTSETTSPALARDAQDRPRRTASSGRRGRQAAGARLGPFPVPAERWALAVLLGATAALYLWGLGESGWANSFYSAAAQAGSVSWKAFFFGSSDAASSITVDKTPLALWPMGLSVRLFGLSSWSILVPQALEGVAAVGPAPCHRPPYDGLGGRWPARRRDHGADPRRGADVPVQQPRRDAGTADGRVGVRHAPRGRGVGVDGPDRRRSASGAVACARRCPGRSGVPGQDAPGVPGAPGPDRRVRDLRRRSLAAADPAPAGGGRGAGGRGRLVAGDRDAVAGRRPAVRRRLPAQLDPGADARLQRPRPPQRVGDRVGRRWRGERRAVGRDRAVADVRLRGRHPGGVAAPGRAAPRGRRPLVRARTRGCRAARGADAVARLAAGHRPHVQLHGRDLPRVLHGRAGSRDRGAGRHGCPGPLAPPGVAGRHGVAGTDGGPDHRPVLRAARTGRVVAAVAAVRRRHARVRVGAPGRGGAASVAHRGHRGRRDRGRGRAGRPCGVLPRHGSDAALRLDPERGAVVGRGWAAVRRAASGALPVVSGQRRVVSGQRRVVSGPARVARGARPGARPAAPASAVCSTAAPRAPP